MKKYAILLASILAFSVVACQKKKDETAAPADAAAPTTDAAKPAEAPKKDAAKK